MSTLEIKSNIANNEEKLAVECGYSSVLRFAIEVQAPLELRSYRLFFTSGTSAKGCEHRIKYNQIK